MKKLFIIIMGMLIFAITGCSTSTDYARRMAPGMSPVFHEGYAEGCDSGLAAAGNPYYQYKKNLYKFNNDEEYRDGWLAGYDACKTTYTNTLNMLR